MRKYITRLLVILLVSPVMIGCSSQAFHVNEDGSVEVEGYNRGDQQELPQGEYKLHLRPGQWYKDQAGFVRIR